mgnify:CR=1 FL=1
MFTRAEAEKLGYTFEQDADHAHVLAVLKDGAEVEKVGSGVPLFFALRSVAEREGVAFPAEVAPAVVKQVSGEKYVEPPPPAPGPVVLSAEKKQAALLAEVSKLDPKTATTEQVIAAIKKTFSR